MNRKDIVKSITKDVIIKVNIEKVLDLIIKFILLINVILATIKYDTKNWGKYIIKIFAYVIFTFVLFIINTNIIKDRITFMPKIKYTIVKPIVAPSLSFL